MSALPEPDVIEVRAWGLQVGAVAPDPVTRGTYAFQYSDEWIESGLELAPFFCPLPDDDALPQVFLFPEHAATVFQGLPGFLADALPDKFGNNVIRAYLARKGYASDTVPPLAKMAYIGGRAMGALEFNPAIKLEHQAAHVLDIRRLVEAARSALHAPLDAPPGAQQAALEHLIDIGSSAGGMRAKAVVAWNPKTQSLKSGQFDAPLGYSHWLIKFDGVGDDGLGETQHFGRVEYAYAQMARAAGIRMMDCDLFEENGRAHFMTQRFDRLGNTKRHALTLGGLMHLDYTQTDTNDYVQLMQAVRRLNLGQRAIDESFRRMAFNVMARNHDDHVKNFGFLMDEYGEWQLSPAYDVCHSFDPTNTWVRRHLMLVDGKGDAANEPDDAITYDDLIAFADKHGVTGAADILADVTAAVDSWPHFASQAGLSSRWIDRIGGDHRRLSPSPNFGPNL